MSDERLFIRPMEAARLLGVTLSCVYFWIREKHLPSTNVGRTILIPRAAFDAWVKERTDQSMEGLNRRERSSGGLASADADERARSR